MDLLTVIVGFISFGMFLAVHAVIFRWVRPEQLLKSLLTCMLALEALPALLMGVFYMRQAADASWQGWVCAGLLAMVIQGLLCFVYVLCVFGPYETSVRMRLVREIAAAGPAGIALKELGTSYNAGTIVDMRLGRLMGSGDIVEQDGLYRVTRPKNLFFIFDAIAGVLKKWIDR